MLNAEPRTLSDAATDRLATLDTLALCDALPVAEALLSILGEQCPVLRASLRALVSEAEDSTRAMTNAAYAEHVGRSERYANAIDALRAAIEAQVRDDAEEREALS